jgi:hypothetical protein
MAYYIFLKSLRSLEEFRKNPHVKIPPKSSSTIFQSLAKFKNQILIRKFFFFFPFLAFGPADPAARQASSAQPATSLPPPSRALACRPAQATLSRPTRPSQPTRPSGPAAPASSSSRRPSAALSLPPRAAAPWTLPPCSLPCRAAATVAPLPPPR